MASITAGALEACLREKLRAAKSEGRHKKYRILDDDGVYVGWTELSRSWRDQEQLSSDMVQRIKRQLGISRTADLVDLIGCPLSRDEYIALARAS